MSFSMERWVGKVAVVTGASAGIGRAIAEQLVETGLKVVGLARRKELVEEHAKSLSGKKGKLYAVKCDVSKEEEVVSAFKWIKGNIGPVAILINNAGVIGRTNLIDGDYKIWKSILDTNVLGLCVATREAVRDMKANKTEGHIIHINSIVGHTNAYHPEINVYGGSKFAVTALTNALRQEFKLHNLRIKVTSISPAIVETELFERHKFDENTLLGQAAQSDIKLQSEDVVNPVIYALSTAPHVQVHEIILRHISSDF